MSADLLLDVEAPLRQNYTAMTNNEPEEMSDISIDQDGEWGKHDSF